jgi:hypothetical protein
VQTEDFSQPEQLFNENYAYFSGYSTTWLEHCQAYAKACQERFALGPEDLVIEVASNDGSWLQYAQSLGLGCLGIEPTESTANAARAKGLPVLQSFFSTQVARQLADQGQRASLMVANNVLAHVPDLNDFVGGFRELLRPQGVAVFEFPHLLLLLQEAQFDTIYHEHYSYLSFSSVCRIFEKNGLSVFDVQPQSTHGGSLRVFAQLAQGGREVCPSVPQLLAREAQAGLLEPRAYSGFQVRVEKIKNQLLGFLLKAKAEGHSVAAYGAAAKGNTLLNFAGVRSDLLNFVVDRNPQKQGKYLPGSRIPILAEEALREKQPHYLLVLPWNLRAEISHQLAYIRDWGATFVTAIPELTFW